MSERKSKSGLKGGDGADTIYGIDGDYDVKCGDGNDSISGIIGASDIRGGKGSDTISALGVGTLKGGKGKDLLDGGPGKDELVGGKDNDTFQFSDELKKSNVDKILDFEPNKDTIALEQGVFAGIGGSLSKKEFEIGKEADDNKDRIIYDKKKGKLYHDADGKGGDDQDLFAKLDKKLKLDHNDFDMVLIV
ncbi:MAG: calcium-binding protein [Hyphomicrobiales bacterium]|nr:calcium-binding protein [Hyphomicrobiales bacterium]